MTGDEKTNYTRIGLGLSGVVVNNMTAEIIWRTVEGLQKKKGKFSISDSVEIEMLVKGKLEKKRISLEENSKKSERISERKKHQSEKFGYTERNVFKPTVKKEDKSSVHFDKYKSQADFKEKSSTLKFRNRDGRESELTFLRKPKGLVAQLLVDRKQVILTRFQNKDLIELAKKYGVQSKNVYDVVSQISDNFKSYRDASGRTIKVSR